MYMVQEMGDYDDMLRRSERMVGRNYEERKVIKIYNILVYYKA